MTLPTQNLLPLPKLQFFNATGVPLAGGTVMTFASDGSTPKATYQDPFGLVLNTNPIVLDSGGYALIYGTGQYVWQVEDSLGNLIYTEPSADPSAILGVSSAMLPVIQASTTSEALALLGGQPSGIGLLPWGVCIPFAGSSPPSPWVLCYGQAISRTANPNLFGAIGTSWGAGDGSTTFNVPDLRGRVWAGVDGMGGTQAERLTSASMGVITQVGVAGGNEFTQAHVHGVTDPGHTHTLTSTVESPLATNRNTSFSGAFGEAAAATTLSTTGISIANAFSGESQNVQPTACGNWIIQQG